MENTATQINFPRHALDDIERRLAPNIDVKKYKTLGEVFVRLGFMKPKDCARVIAHAEKHGKRFGEAAIRMRFIRKEQLQIALSYRYGYLRYNRFVGSLPKGLVVIRNPNSKAGDQIRNLRMRFLTELPKEILSYFCVAPAAGNVRADYLAANLAASFAQLQRRVLLIDTDLYRPRLHRFFNVPETRGFSDVLCRETPFEDAVCDSIVTNLSLMTAGVHRRGAQELIASDNMEAVFERARSQYDIVMALTAPGTREADGRLVWAAAGAALVTARRNVTRFKELKSLNATFRQLDVDIIGSALTR